LLVVLDDMLDRGGNQIRTRGPASIDGRLTRPSSLGDPFDLLSDKQRNAYADNVNHVAAPDALLLMSGFTKLPSAGINEKDLRRRFPDWDSRQCPGSC
jgi:hypothetical protein